MLQRPPSLPLSTRPPFVCVSPALARYFSLCDTRLLFAFFVLVWLFASSGRVVHVLSLSLSEGLYPSFPQSLHNPRRGTYYPLRSSHTAEGVCVCLLSQDTGGRFVIRRVCIASAASFSLSCSVRGTTCPVTTAATPHQTSSTGQQAYILLPYSSGVVGGDNAKLKVPARQHAHQFLPSFLP